MNRFEWVGPMVFTGAFPEMAILAAAATGIAIFMVVREPLKTCFA
jgi:hypothetical protein